MTPVRHWIVLGALVAGIAIGAWVDQAGSSAVHVVAHGIEAIGAVWLNALRMTVGPLVFAMLVSAVASVSDAMSTSRLASLAVAWFTFLLFVAGLLALLLSEALLALWPVNRATAEAFIAAVSQGNTTAPVSISWSDWLQQLLPPNIIAAAADNAILALVVFAILFGFATTRLPAPQRNALTGFFSAMAEAMVVIVHWVLLAAPIGVFALALGVGRQAGFKAAGLLLQYATTVAAVIAIATLLIYVVVALRSPVSVRRFALAVAPVQVVAASTQSSLATLPAMIECARERLDVTPRIAHLVLPLAVAVFRYTSPLGNLAVCLFIAAMYGIEPGVLQLTGAICVAVAVSVGTVGLPGQVSFIASVAPICAALGLPVEVLGTLIAVEILPDIFRTIGNVTADVAVATLLDVTEQTSDVPA